MDETERRRRRQERETGAGKVAIDAAGAIAVGSKGLSEAREIRLAPAFRWRGIRRRRAPQMEGAEPPPARAAAAPYALPPRPQPEPPAASALVFGLPLLAPYPTWSW